MPSAMTMPSGTMRSIWPLTMWAFGQLHGLVVIAVRFRDAGAAEIVVGRQLSPQLGVLDGIEVAPVLALHGLALRAGIEAPVDPPR